MVDMKALIRTERLSLIELLENLTPQQWAVPSLCGGWSVQDVAAHVAWAPAISTVEAAAGLVRVGLRPNAFNSRNARLWSSRGTAAILEQLRTNAATDAKPPGVPRTAALVDAVVHGLDIRRPLGRPRPVPPGAFVPTADFCAATRWSASVLVGGSVRRRIDGVRLVAEDVDWSHGNGPDVRASTQALILMLTGRRVGADELTGPGAPLLYSRL